MGGINISGIGVKLLEDRKSISYPLILLFLIIAAFLMDNLVFGPRVGGLSGNYIYPSLMWLLLFAFTFYLPGVKNAGSLRSKRLVRWLALLCVFIGLLFIMVQGFMGGFGQSPYDHSLVGITINILTLGSSLLAVEFTRSWLLNRFFAKRPRLGIPVVALFYMIYSLPLNKLTNLHGAKAMTEFLGTNIFPGLVQNLLATLLAFLGGPIPAVIYRGSMLAVERLSPVLPQSNWAITTLLGTLAPIIGMILVYQIYNEEAGHTRASHQGGSMFSPFFTSIACILIIWFCVGVFSYSPRVIVSGSMVPVMNIGDIVVVHKIPGSQARLGDIVMFQIGSMKVTHRIVRVEGEAGQRYFTTKGDANSNPEGDLLYEKNVLGKVVMVIPQLGKLTLLLRGS